MYFFIEVMTSFNDTLGITYISDLLFLIAKSFNVKHPNLVCLRDLREGGQHK